jgi:8-oxo-dGTP diphosphatase
MPDRSSSARPAAASVPRAFTLTVDVVLFTPRGSELAVLLAPIGGRARDKVALPSDALRGDESLDEAATRISRDALGELPSFLEQAGAHGGARRQSDTAQIAVTYFGLVPVANGVHSEADWVAIGDLGETLAVRQREEIEKAVAAMRAQVDQRPIAFKLLPAAFTLSELQSVYELLLGRRLHKASFRRSLHASALVEATDEWRSEGRGRPAQLFRYAPPRRRRARRGIRFDLL